MSVRCAAARRATYLKWAARTLIKLFAPAVAIEPSDVRVFFGSSRLCQYFIRSLRWRMNSEARNKLLRLPGQSESTQSNAKSFSHAFNGELIAVLCHEFRGSGMGVQNSRFIMPSTKAKMLLLRCPVPARSITRFQSVTFLSWYFMQFAISRSQDTRIHDRKACRKRCRVWKRNLSSRDKLRNSRPLVCWG